MATIGRLNYQIVANTAGFTKGMVATRNELNLAKRLMRDTRSPAVALGESLDRVGDIAGGDGATGLKNLESEIGDLRRSFQAGTMAEDEFLEQMINLRNGTPGASEAMAGMNREIDAGKRLMKQLESPITKYQRDLEKLQRLQRLGEIGQEELNEAVEALDRKFPQVADYNSQLLHLRGQLTRGEISQREFTDSLAHARREMVRTDKQTGLTAFGFKKLELSQIQQLPGINRMSGAFSGMHPALLLAAAGIGTLMVASRLGMEAVRKLTAAVTEQFAELDKLAKTARGMNIVASSLESLRLAGAQLSGMEPPEMDAALKKLQKGIGETVAGIGEAKAAFGSMNLDAAALAKLPLEESLTQIADKFAAIESPTEKAYLATRLFGEAGQKMIPMLEAGGEALLAYQAHLDSLRVPLTAGDLAGIEKMNDTMGEVGTVVDGLVQQLAADLAPTITAIAEALIETLKPGSEIGEQIRFAFEMIPPVIAWAADETNEWIGRFQLLQAQAVTAAAGIVGALAMIDRAQAAVNPFREPIEELQLAAESLQQQATATTAIALDRIADGASGTIQKRVQELRAELAAAAGEQGSGADSDAAKAAAEAAQKFQGDVEKLTTSLQEQIATFGMSQTETQIWQLEQQAAAAAASSTAGALSAEAIAMRETIDQARGLSAELAELERQQQLEESTQRAVEGLQSFTNGLEEQIATFGMSRTEALLWKAAEDGLSPTMIENARAMQEQLDAMTARDSLLEKGRKLTESMRSPLEVHTDRIAELNEMIAAGAISWETFLAAAEEANETLAKDRDELEKPLVVNFETRGLDGMLAGSADAMEMMRQQKELFAQPITPAEIPDAEVPTIADRAPVAPGLGVDRPTVPDLPQLDPPTITQPAIGVDVPQLPQLAPPEIPATNFALTAPDLPQLQVDPPTITQPTAIGVDVPQLPQLAPPEIPATNFALSAPDLPQLQVDPPTITQPTAIGVDVPQLPQLAPPEIPASNFALSAPDLPQLQVDPPTITQPTAIGVDVPQFAPPNSAEPGTDNGDEVLRELVREMTDQLADAITQLQQIAANTEEDTEPITMREMRL